MQSTNMFEPAITTMIQFDELASLRDSTQEITRNKEMNQVLGEDPPGDDDDYPSSDGDIVDDLSEDEAEFDRKVLLNIIKESKLSKLLQNRIKWNPENPDILCKVIVGMQSIDSYMRTTDHYMGFCIKCSQLFVSRRDCERNLFTLDAGIFTQLDQSILSRHQLLLHYIKERQNADTHVTFSHAKTHICKSRHQIPPSNRPQPDKPTKRTTHHSHPDIYLGKRHQTETHN